MLAHGWPPCRRFVAGPVTGVSGPADAGFGQSVVAGCRDRPRSRCRRLRSDTCARCPFWYRTGYRAVVTLVGYARVSTLEQDPALQHDALVAAGAARVFTDHASGATAARPQLIACLDYLRAGDTLAVWRIDRLGRSVADLTGIVNGLAGRGIEFRSLTEAIDTTTVGGELVFHVFAAVAQMERRLISERTRAGLTAARARGRVGGRPTVMTPDRLAAALDMRRQGRTLNQIAATLGVGRSSLVRGLTGASVSEGQEPSPQEREPVPGDL